MSCDENYPNLKKQSKDSRQVRSFFVKCFHFLYKAPVSWTSLYQNVPSLITGQSVISIGWNAKHLVNKILGQPLCSIGLSSHGCFCKSMLKGIRNKNIYVTFHCLIAHQSLTALILILFRCFFKRVMVDIYPCSQWWMLIFLTFVTYMCNLKSIVTDFDIIA